MIQINRFKSDVFGILIPTVGQTGLKGLSVPHVFFSCSLDKAPSCGEY